MIRPILSTNSASIPPTQRRLDEYWIGHKIAGNTNQPSTRLIQQRIPTSKNSRIDQTENIAFGHSFNHKPDENATRVFYQNVNGIRPHQQWQDAYEIGYSATNHWVEIMGLTETNLDWSDKSIKSAVKHSLKRFWKSTHIDTASSPITFDSHYQPGGELLLVGNKWTGRVIHSAEDPSGLGRWIATTIQGKRGIKLTTVTAYQVCKQHSQAGPTTAYMQQYVLLRRNHEKPDPRQSFVQDLIKYLKQLIKEKHEIILMLDANEHLTSPKSKLGQELLRIGLSNVYQAVHGTHDTLAEEPATYHRGSKCIDYIYGSNQVIANTTAAGITAFQEGVSTSDHRGIFFDVKLDNILGRSVQMAPPSQRGIISTNPRTVPKFRATVKKYLDDHNVFKRSETMSTAEQIEGVDEDMTRALRHGEIKHGTQFGYPWSPKLMHAKRMVRFWLLWLSEFKTNRSYRVQRLILGKLMKMPEEELERDYNFVEVRKGLKEASKQLQRIIEEAQELREQLLEERIVAAALGDNRKLESIAKRIRAAEASRRQYLRIKTALGKIIRGGIQFILVPSHSEPERWDAIFDPDEITKRLLDRNRRHFGQAEGTPFTIGPLKGLFEWNGTNQHSQDLLSGKLDVEKLDVSSATKAILQALQNNDNAAQINDNITGDDLQTGFRKWSENTSTSPVRHLGLYKALFAFEPQLKDDNGQDVPKDSTAMFEVMAQIINRSRHKGYVLQRWKRVTNTMLEKIPGKPRIDKLRVIHLYEADLNLYLGILWGKRLMANAEAHHMLGDEQWGSRKGKSCIDVVLLKHFSYMYSHLTKTTIGTFDNDAKSCYDRIIVNLAMLVSQHMGMTQAGAHHHAEFLRQAQFNLKTKLGISDEDYSNAESSIHGTGQGSRASPSVWTIISAILIRLVRQRAKGIHFTDPTGSIHVRRWIDGFVDDTTLWCNDDITEFAQTEDQLGQLQQIVQDLQLSAQWWEMLLHGSGGQLELTKCLYYILSWKFDEEGKATIRTPNEIQAPTISITQSHTQQPQTIHHRSCYQSHRTLGVRENPAHQYAESTIDHDNDEFSILRKKSYALARHLMHCKLSASDLYKLYWSIYIPSMTYSLPIMAMTQQQLQSIQSLAISAILPRLGFNRHMPRKVVFGPRELGGIGLSHLYVQQGTLGILSMLRHIRFMGIVGKTIMICFNWFQKFNGISFSCLEEPDRPIPHTDSNWFVAAREFLTQSSLRCHLNTSFYRVQTRRSNDRILMEDAMLWFSPTQVQAINRVRIFLQVETLADCCNAQGDALLPAFFNPTEEQPSTSWSTDYWPRQTFPGPKSRHSWKAFLRRYTVSPAGTATSMLLAAKLGSWHNTSGRRWKWSYSREMDMIIHTQRTVEALTFKAYQVTRRSRRQWSHSAHVWSSDPWDALALVPVDHIAGYEVSTPLLQTRGRQTIRPTLTFDQFVESLDPWERDLLANHRETAPGVLCSWLHSDSTEVPLLAVSDGGARGQFGSFGWVLAFNRRIVWEGWGFARGYPMQSLRAEAYGRLAMLCFLIRYCEFYSITQKSTDHHSTKYTDSTGLLLRLKKIRSNFLTPYSCMLNDYDVIQQIQATEQKLPFTFDEEWVKGHQDDDTDIGALPIPAYLNVHADRLATYALSEHTRAAKPKPLLPLPACQAYLQHVDRTFITSKEKSQLLTGIGRREMRQYYMEKYDWSNRTYDSINWEAFEKANLRSPPGRQRFVTKWCCKWIYVGHRESRETNSEGLCHRCGKLEDYDHLMLCPDRRQWRRTFLTALQSFLAKERTDPYLRTEIGVGLGQWFNNQVDYDPPTDISVNPTPLSWSEFLRGFIPATYSTRQEAYLSSPPLRETLRTLTVEQRSQFTGSEWTTRLIQWLWEQIFLLWQTRNSEIHNPNEGTTRERERLMLHVRSLYGSQHQLGVHDRAVFDQPIEEIEKLSLTRLRAWVNNTAQIVKFGTRDELERTKTQNRDIRDFFKAPAPRADPPD